MNIWSQKSKSMYVPKCLDTSALEVMLRKLKVEVDAERIDNDWACGFINEMYVKLKQGYSFSEKQKSKIEELFEKY